MSTTDLRAEEQSKPKIPIGRNKPLLIFWIGQSISLMGSQIYSFVLAWEVIRITGSSLIMGTILIANVLPVLLFSLFGGAIGDRWPRRRILICSDGLNFAVSSIWGSSLLMRVPTLSELFAFAIFVGLTKAFFSPAYRAILPELVSSDQIPRAVSINQFVNRSTNIIAPIISGLLIALLPFYMIILLNGISYGAAFLSNWFLPTYMKIAARSSSSIWREIHQGWRYFISQKELFWSVILITLANLGAATIDVNLPKFIEHDLAWNSKIYGQVIAGFGIGSLVLSLFLSIKPVRKLRGLVYLTSLVLGGIVLLFIPSVRSSWQLEGILIGIGITFSTTSAMSGILLQELTSPEYRSRVMGIVVISSALLPLGYGLWGMIGDFWGNASVFTGAGAIIVLVALLGFTTPLRAVQ